MFAEELEYKTQSVVGWNLKPDILIHGSPCQDMSIAGHQGKAKSSDGRINRGKGADKDSGTRSSLMWETIEIIKNMGKWKPKYVIWENVKNVLNGYNRKNFDGYIREMERMGYSDIDFNNAAKVQKKKGRFCMPLYKQSGNSICVPILESIFRKILLGEVAEPVMKECGT